MTTFVVKRPTRLARIFQVIRELCSSPLGTFSFVIVLLFFVVGITADYITPYDPIKIDIRNKLFSLVGIIGWAQISWDAMYFLV